MRQAIRSGESQAPNPKGYCESSPARCFLHNPSDSLKNGGAPPIGGGEQGKREVYDKRLAKVSIALHRQDPHQHAGRQLSGDCIKSGRKKGEALRRAGE